MNLAQAKSAFEHAPSEWSPEVAEQLAQAEGIELGDGHWEELSALQEYYARHEFDRIHVRELSDALDEKFHDKGGVRYLYTLFPKGPIAQGCRLAGLEMPAGAVDKGFGSVI
jgi:tRNA 2-thiouridine synthesizing protein E